MITSNKFDILETIKNKSGNLIAVHGAPGAGKTTLAEFLAEELSGCLIHLDDFIQKNPEGRYSDFLNKDKLTQVLTISQTNNPIVIVEGICLLEILNSISFKPTLTIYVKNQYDKDNLKIKVDISKTAYSEVIGEIDNLLARIPSAGGNCLDKDNARYHFENKPIGNSDIVYIWEVKP
jgi:uridine kinase